MSLSVSVTGLMSGLSLIVANGGQNVSRLTSAVTTLRTSGAWIPERSATRLREADLDVLSKLGNQGLEWRLEP